MRSCRYYVMMMIHVSPRKVSLKMWTACELCVVSIRCCHFFTSMCDVTIEKQWRVSFVSFPKDELLQLACCAGLYLVVLLLPKHRVRTYATCSISSNILASEQSLWNSLWCIDWYAVPDMYRLNRAKADFDKHSRQDNQMPETNILHKHKTNPAVRWVQIPITFWTFRKSTPTRQ